MIEGSDNPPIFRPKFHDLLSPSEQEQYSELRATLSSQMCRNRRGKRLEGFAEILGSIRTFCIRHDDGDWKRCLVCGVCWLPNGIAVNNRQLSMLIDKCKSSINGSLQKMGCSTLQSRNESSGSLSDAIPLLKNNFNELREWTIRLFLAATPQPTLPAYSVAALYPLQSPVPSQYHAFSIQPRLPTVTMAKVEQKPAGFFDDDFALAPSFLTEDPGAPGENAGARGIEDDLFGFFGAKW